MTLVEGVVRQRAGTSLEVVSARPSGPLLPMSQALLERTARAAQLEAGLWRLSVQRGPVQRGPGQPGREAGGGEAGEGEPRADVTRLGDAGDAVAVVRVAREAKQAVVVREVLFSAGDADASLAERLSTLVSEAVAVAGRELQGGEERWLELVIS